MTGFCWGAATAAYQIEGGWDADGKGPSVWDTLAHRGGFAGGATGDRACDHYHRLPEDLALIAGLGISSYRFSISWPRVQPDGQGRWNPAGRAFYDRLVDGLLSIGVEPTVTLYHWDHPQTIEEQGGWSNRETALRFADYAAGVVDLLGDRVTRWITLNEPQSVVVGNILGFSRPSGPLGKAGIQLAHHLLLGHGLAVERLREAKVRGDVGIALNLSGIEPASESPADRAAAVRAEAYEERLFLDPILTGAYPLVDGQPVIEADADDLAVIAAPIDFLGVNWYAPGRVARSPEGQDGELARLLGGLVELLEYARVPIPGAPTNLLGGPIAPSALGLLLIRLRDSYPGIPPIVITESGLPLEDYPTADGHVHDQERIQYLEACLHQVAVARAAGVDVRGYFVWSLLDNLEWGLGYRPRFGLVHVDFDTLVRTPKDSYGWYRDFIAEQMRS